jgi:hypothetical protein
MLENKETVQHMLVTATMADEEDENEDKSEDNPEDKSEDDPEDHEENESEEEESGESKNFVLVNSI